MTATTSYSVFHQWLLAEQATASASACAIILHVSPPVSGAKWIDEIAEYLNEYDDDGDGSWLPATGELIAKIAADDNYRQLLGIPENDPLESDCRQILTALGQRGRVVFQSPDAAEADLGQIKSFRAGVGLNPNDFKDCHLVLNPNLIDGRCVAHIIGDVFLEWLHCDFRRSAGLHQIE